ncbi:MAG: NAD(P)/FAD-dependent oxidoreductase [Planctomycetes bacterium]|nr:NAD(P)/FAD-dependent oxidoreductase [Planctomycetota bacterium]
MDFDVAVIGGGVVGLSIACSVARRGHSVLLFERHDAFGQETSSRNSEVIHAGIYYGKDSLKAKLCVEGRHLLYDICEANDIPYRKCGKIIVAVEEQELASLDSLLKRGQTNGVEGLRILSEAEVHEYEPQVKAVGGLLSEETGIVDSHRLAGYYAASAESDGASLLRGAAVTGLRRGDDAWSVDYRDSEEEGTIQAAVVINAAGLGAQEVMRLAGLDPDAMGLTLHLAKGEYFSISGEKRKRISMLVYPSPEADLVGLGIHTVVDLGGGLKLGPNAFYVDEVEYTVDPAHAKDFQESAASYLPWLEEYDLAPDMSGMRPKLAGPGEPARDFHIAEESAHGAPNFINLVGIESPGLTASPAIGEYVAGMVSDCLA